MCLYGRKCSRSKDIRRRNLRMSISDSMVPPSEWEHQTERLKIAKVQRASNEWMEIESRFKATLPTASIVEILRIQNKMLWKSYGQEAARLKRRNKGRVNEKLLFHGTRTNDPSLIYNGEEGFEMRLCSGMWGQANYFAVDASYSHCYAFVRSDVREMFLAKVLTGDSVKLEPDSSLRLPPEKPRPSRDVSTLQYAKRRYDTVNGFTNGTEVYMTYDNHKAYPAYLIQYKK